MTAKDIAERFDISLKAAQVRLHEFERQSRIKSGKLRPLPQSIVSYLVEARKQGHRITSINDYDNNGIKRTP